MIKNNLLKKNCKVFGTYEWAQHTLNIIDGCIHNCKYCYSKEMAIRFKRKTVSNWETEVIRKDLLSKIKKYSGKIMFPSTHDISPENLKVNTDFIKKLLAKNNEILIVSKPHIECIKYMCHELSRFKNNILFRFSIGSMDSDILKIWEPGAPSFEERFESLKYAFDMGFQTSISCEPMLDSVDNIINLVELVQDFVTDSIWIGKPNFLNRRLKMNGFDDEFMLNVSSELLKQHSDEKIWILYLALKNNSKIKWKESIKNIIGIKLPDAIGMDI